jgi:hypothetical protein
MVEYAYIVDFASVLIIYRCVRNTGEASEKPFCKRVKRLASRLLHNHALTRGCLEAEEVFYGGKVRGLHVFRED